MGVDVRQFFINGLRALAVLFLAQVVLSAPVPAQAQQNSSQAIEAVQRHRAEAGNQRAAGTPAGVRPFRSTANPNVDPNLSLKSCLDHVGMNVVARDRCMRQHCEGRWGQGDCPAGGNVLGPAGDVSKSRYGRTPLGRCLSEAGRNPFKRDACGWRHCNNRRDAPECAALMPYDAPGAGDN